MKTKTIPFDLETAMKIQAGEIKGKIKTRRGYDARILCTDLIGQAQPVLVAFLEGNGESVSQYTKRGNFYINGKSHEYDLVLEVPDNEPQFKVGDKVVIHPNSTHSEFVKGYCNQTGYIANIKGDKIYVVVIGAFQDCFFPYELELVKEQAKHEFKPFDKVLVRDREREHPWWTPAIFQEAKDYPAPYMASGFWWRECIPYEGNQELVGTCNCC